MSTLQESMTTVPGSGDGHSGAVAKWRGRAIGALVAVLLLVAVGFVLQRTGVADLGSLFNSSDATQTAQTGLPDAMNGTFPAMGDAGSMPAPPSDASAAADTTASSADAAVPASDESAGAPSEAASATSETESVDAATSGRTMSAVAGISGATLLDSPGGSALTSAEVGARLTVYGQSEDGGWLLVSDGSTSGWVEESDVIGFNMASLPVLSVQGATAAVNTGAGQVTAGASSEDSTTGATESAVVAATASTDTAATENAPTAQTELVTVIATVSLDDGRLNIRSGPGTDYDVLGKALSGDQYYALGRDSSGDWVMVLVNGDEVGWLAARYVVLSESAAELPDATDNSLLTSLPITEAGASVETSEQTSLLSQLPALSETYAAASAASTDGDTVLVSAVSPSTLAASTAGSTVTNSMTAASSGLDGTLVFEDSNGGTIYAVNLATGEMTALTSGADPTISPDGSTVAFVRDGGSNGLYLIDIDGSNERMIWSGRSGLSSPSWSPDGNWIVFSYRGDYEECWQMGPMCVAEDPGHDAVLVRTYSYELGIVDTNGENYHEPPALDSAVAVNWGDAGIIYQSTSGIQLTSDEAYAENQLVSFNYLKPTTQDPALQPGGNLVVYQSREDSHYEIYTMNVDGSNIQALTHPATTLVDEIPSNVAPAWSPDGQYIVFLSNRTDDGSAGAWRIWVMDADGSNQRPLDIDVTIDYTYGVEQMLSWGV